jgi:hypothetical protein
MPAMEELGHFQLPGIVYRSLLKHEVMAADEWHNNGLQDLFTASLCIQIAIDKMQLCSLSVAYACPYHSPTSNVDISKPLAHTTPYTLPAICPVQLKLGFIHEEHTSPVCQCHMSKLSICPLKSVTTPNCSQVKTLVRTTSTQMSFLTLRSFLTVCAEILCFSIPTVPSAVWVAGLRRSRRWRSRM